MSYFSTRSSLRYSQITLVGKYTNLHDSYLSVIKSLEHSAMRCGKKLHLIWVDASHLEEQIRSDDPAAFHKAWHELCTANVILVPGCFGHRGTEGMISAAKWARENKIPYLGICLGMQFAVIECHRHRYEVNPEYTDRLAKSGLDFIEKDEKGVKMEILELKDHPWYVGVQFHPEYLSRVLDPSKLYLSFVAAAAGVLEKVTVDMATADNYLAASGGSAEVNGSLSKGLNGVRI